MTTPPQTPATTNLDVTHSSSALPREIRQLKTIEHAQLRLKYPDVPDEQD